MALEEDAGGLDAQGTVKRNLSSIRVHLEEQVRACQEQVSLEQSRNTTVKARNAVLSTLLHARKALDQLLAAAEITAAEAEAAVAEEARALEKGEGAGAGAAGACTQASESEAAAAARAARQQQQQLQRQQLREELLLDAQLLDAQSQELLHMLSPSELCAGQGQGSGATGASTSGAWHDGGGSGGGSGTLPFLGGRQPQAASAASVRAAVMPAPAPRAREEPVPLCGSIGPSTARLLHSIVLSMPGSVYNREEFIHWWGEHTRQLALLLHQGQRGMCHRDVVKERMVKTMQAMSSRLGAMILSQPACVELFTLNMETNTAEEPPVEHWDRVVACMELTRHQVLSFSVLNRWWAGTSARMRERRQQLAGRALEAPEDVELQAATLQGIQAVQKNYLVWIVAAMVVGQGAVLTPTQLAECYVAAWPWQPSLPNVCGAAERAVARDAAGAGAGGGGAHGGRGAAGARRQS